MVLPIVLYGNSILRQKGKKIERITDDIRCLIEDMMETMYTNEGVGLAAQQIGHALQLTVIDISSATERPSKMWIDDKEVDPKNFMPMVLINPEIELIKTKDVDTEGCLSFPGISADIRRSKRVHVKAMQPNESILEFSAAGLLGRPIQHEYDHLQGVLFTDHMSPEDKTYWREKIDSIRQLGRVIH